jgi:hypothetical protein
VWTCAVIGATPAFIKLNHLMAGQMMAALPSSDDRAGLAFLPHAVPARVVRPLTPMVPEEQDEGPEA